MSERGPSKSPAGRGRVSQPDSLCVSTGQAGAVGTSSGMAAFNNLLLWFGAQMEKERVWEARPGTKRGLSLHQYAGREMRLSKGNVRSVCL